VQSTMAEFFEWDCEKHSLWIDEMDGQHQAIVALMNSLYRLDGERAPRADLSNLLDTLREYTGRHFKDEEAYMAATGYPRLDVHQVIHRDLLIKMDDHIHRFNAGNGRLGPDLLSYLRYWLTAHITGVDRHYARYALRGPPATEGERERTRTALARRGEVS
jgi:hemerythrin